MRRRDVLALGVAVFGGCTTDPKQTVFREWNACNEITDGDVRFDVSLAQIPQIKVEPKTLTSVKQGDTTYFTNAPVHGTLSSPNMLDMYFIHQNFPFLALSGKFIVDARHEQAKQLFFPQLEAFNYSKAAINRSGDMLAMAKLDLENHNTSFQAQMYDLIHNNAFRVDASLDGVHASTIPLGFLRDNKLLVLATATLDKKIQSEVFSVDMSGNAQHIFSRTDSSAYSDLSLLHTEVSPDGRSYLLQVTSQAQCFGKSLYQLRAVDSERKVSAVMAGSSTDCYTFGVQLSRVCPKASIAEQFDLETLEKRASIRYDFPCKPLAASDDYVVARLNGEVQVQNWNGNFVSRVHQVVDSRSYGAPRFSYEGNELFYVTNFLSKHPRALALATLPSRSFK